MSVCQLDGIDLIGEPERLLNITVTDVDHRHLAVMTAQIRQQATEKPDQEARMSDEESRLMALPWVLLQRGTQDIYCQETKQGGEPPRPVDEILGDSGTAGRLEERSHCQADREQRQQRDCQLQ